MGNADSKESRRESESIIVTDLVSKRSRDSLNTNFTSYDANDVLDDSPTSRISQSENREAEKASGRNGSSSHGSNNTRDDELVSSPNQILPPVSKRISDDQIHVNMAMADLMAYLQVVANNSNNLPLTRRDDPELDRTVSTLSSEDYARKSAAFIPADVRVIGGTFTRYGRVWDLPTSDEYNACDGAQEPGRSYGGACCNTLLKVLYDSAIEADGNAHNEAVAKSLFEDDDDDEEESTVMGKSFRSMYSIDYSHMNHNIISWARILTQMKSEFKDIGYSQYPKISTTRKLDLGKPFSFQPDNFDPHRNKKRSLLIGCNYVESNGAELKASHDDIRSIKDYIVNVHGFSEAADDMMILIDEDGYMQPTFINIIEALKKVSEESQPGDAVFVQFSGHGGRVLDSTEDSEAESYDEVIIPVDYKQAGLVRDTLIFKTLLAPMRYGVTVTIMIDCCDTGMLLELPYSWSAKSDRKDVVPKLSANDDFSFVRFLKVVKTLYESSTFTQLGKTVGSALNPLGLNHESMSQDDDHSRKYSKNGNKKKGNANNSSSYNVSTTDSIFEALTDACTSAGRKDANPEGIRNVVSGEKSLQRKDNFFEQMIKGCTLLTTREEEFSDEETFKTRTEDDLSFYSEVDQSYETMTEDEYETRTRRRRR